MSALGIKLSRSTSTSRQRESKPSFSFVDLGNNSERSLSRGREAFQSSGRGGIGNIRQASLSRDARPGTGPDDFSPTRGREPHVHPGEPVGTYLHHPVQTTDYFCSFIPPDEAVPVTFDPHLAIQASPTPLKPLTKELFTNI
jgi:hypothetical protein